MVISLSSFLFAFLLLYDTYTNLKYLLFDIFSTDDSYDINTADDVSGSVIVYWDIILLFLKMAELIKDNLFNRKG